MGKSGLSQLQLPTEHPVSFLGRKKDSIKYLFFTVLFITYRTTAGSIIVKRDHPHLEIQATETIGENEHDVQVIDEHHHKRNQGEITEHNGPLHIHPNNLPANLSFQDVIALRRDAIRYKIRNTSELHVDVHNESSSESTEDVMSPTGISPNGLNSSYLHRIIVVPKAFHFHIPIISRRYMDTNNLPTVSYRAEREDEEKEAPYYPALTTGILPSKDFNDQVYSDASLSFKTLENFQESEEPSVLEKRNVDTTNELLPRITHLFHEGKKLENMESLLDQHPKLIPSVNRKRDSGKLKQDPVEDEFWQFARDAEQETEPPRPVIATKRNVKAVSFSQNIVDSILNHDDDLVKYQTNIKAHAEKLGLKPHEVVHAMVQGKSLNGEDNNDGKRKQVHEIRHVFQAFLRKPEETEQTQGGGEWNTFKPFDAHMKTLKREKRGLKKWLRKWLGPDPTEKTSTTAKPDDIIVKGEPDVQVVIKMKNKPKEQKKEKAQESEEEDSEEKEEEQQEGDASSSTTTKPSTKHHKDKTKQEEKSTKTAPPDPESFENEQEIEVEVHSRKGRKKEKEDKMSSNEKDQKEVKEEKGDEKPKRSPSEKMLKSSGETKERKDT